ncbi:MAG TPA: 5'-3' exonuclease H3TH domain-containing protein, partial [Clostridia bacterium]|nr:5'-3' exonuclease H3TH domain-containing protein [Clostridia bacterium]
MSTQETLLLFDVHSLMNRAFYGIAGHSRLTAPDGFPTGALFAFLNMILKYKEELDPSHIVSAMDMPGDTFRHDQYEDYKAGRSPMPEDLAKQLPLARDLLEALGFQPVGLDRYEADDLIGTMAARAEAAGMKVFIVTGDRDSLQLVSDQTSVVFLSSKKTGSTSEIVDPDTMRQDYGVSPDQWVHMKALMGDSSDNIPGVKGVGAKTALRLIQAYGSLDGVYDHLDQEKGALLRNLKEGKEKAYLSLDLSRIDRQVPLAEADKLLHETSSHLRDDDNLAALLLRLDFRSHLERLGLEGQAAKEKPEISILEDLDAFLQASQGETAFAFFLPDQDGEGLLASQEACVRIKDPKDLDPLLE